MMLTNRSYRPLRLSAICCLLALSACANQELNRQIAASREAIQQAKVAGAPDIAPTEYNAATGKLAKTDVPASDQETAVSLRLAQQAQADANLAHAKADSTRATIAVAELEKSNQALRQTIRNSNPNNKPVEVKP